MKSKDKAPQAIAQVDGVEVEKKANPKVAKPEIGKKLGVMNREQLIYRLELSRRPGPNSLWTAKAHFNMRQVSLLWMSSLSTGYVDSIYP